MNVIGIVGATALGKTPFIDPLIAALVIDGWSVSTIKRAPDSFDMDSPGKLSWGRREAGCGEVMLAGGERLVLMQEFRAALPPTLDELVARLAPVDLVIAEGFHTARVPTVEVVVPGSGKPARWPDHPHVIALVAPTPMAGPLPCFAPGDAAGLADFIVAKLALQRPA
jgi:molybdopterin-guanine dinucleotide biosynthesis protein B